MGAWPQEGREQFKAVSAEGGAVSRASESPAEDLEMGAIEAFQTGFLRLTKSHPAAE